MGRELLRIDDGGDMATCQIADAGKGGANRDVGLTMAQSIRLANTAIGAGNRIFFLGAEQEDPPNLQEPRTQDSKRKNKTKAATSSTNPP